MPDDSRKSVTLNMTSSFCVVILLLKFLWHRIFSFVLVSGVNKVYGYPTYFSIKFRLREIGPEILKSIKVPCEFRWISGDCIE